MSSSVVDFYRGKSVLLTGATGFIGKVLLERLLRACPEIENIYLLIRLREKKADKSVESRLRALLQSPPFTFGASPLSTDKVIAVAGDLTQPGLALSTADRQLLTEKVSVIFHSAATIKFNGPLVEFIVQNVLGTEAILQLAEDMVQLKSIVYVSTAYANCNLPEIEEKVYPLGETSAQTLIERILRENSTETPTIGDSSLLGRPNTYTVSKAIAENLIMEKYTHLPIVICRPSIVTNSVASPVAGWCDSTAGVNGLLLFVCLGLARALKVDCQLKADIIPVDIVVNSLIVTGWHTAVYPAEKAPVVHLTSGVANPITGGQILKSIRLQNLKSPSLKVVRPFLENPPSIRTIRGKMAYHFNLIFSHYLFAYFFDFYLLLTGNKRLMVKSVGKMNQAIDVFEHFTSRQWTFCYENYRRIWEKLSIREQILFESDLYALDWSNYSRSWQLGLRRYLLKEEDSTIGEAVKRLQTVTFLSSCFQIIFHLTLGAFLIFLAKSIVN